MLRRFVASVMEKLYEYDAVRAAKEGVRPLKHLLFGKNDIYLVVELINRARGETCPVMAVLDVGAACGDKTRTFLRSFPRSTVHCFEPQSASRARLARRVARWPDRVVVHAHGLFSDNRTAELRLYSYPDASSVLPIPDYMRREGKAEVGVERVNLRRLDDCLQELSVSKIDLMKIDVEGVEREVLEGAEQALAITDNVFVEISPLRRGPRSGHHIAVFTILHDAGFTFVGQYGDYWFSKDPDVLRAFLGSREAAPRERSPASAPR
jgi:FkbM family methyltransferase